MTLVDYESVIITVQNMIRVCSGNFSGVNFAFTVVTGPSQGETHFCEDGCGNSFYSRGTVGDRREGAGGGYDGPWQEGRGPCLPDGPAGRGRRASEDGWFPSLLITCPPFLAGCCKGIVLLAGSSQSCTHHAVLRTGGWSISLEMLSQVCCARLLGEMRLAASSCDCRCLLFLFLSDCLNE